MGGERKYRCEGFRQNRSLLRDLHLFLQLKKNLTDRNFHEDEKMENEVHTSLRV